MFKNNLPISTILAILIFGISATILTFSVDTIQRNIRYEQETDWILVLIIIGIIFSILLSIGIFIKVNWTRHILAFLLTVFFVAISYALINMALTITFRSILPMLGSFILTLTSYLFFMLLLYNGKVAEEFGQQHMKKEMEDIIDFNE